MSDFDEILAQLNQNVKPKNEVLEYYISNLNEIDTSSHYGYNKHKPETEIWTAKVNRVYDRIKEKTESGQLSDRFHPMESTEIRSTTTRSLEKAIARYTQQYTIIQTYS